MAKGLYEEFIGEIKKGLHEESHPLNRLKEESKLLLESLRRLEEELHYILIHGKWAEAAEALGALKGFSLHQKKLDSCRAYFSSAEDLYYINLMAGEQEEIISSIDELLHILQREDCSQMEKSWRIKSLSRLIQDQNKREEIFYEMLEKNLGEEDWRNLASKFEKTGYLMGNVAVFNPTMRYFDSELKKEELEALITNLPLKLIYKNAEGKTLLLKDFPPDIEVDEWTELPGGARIYYQLKEK